MLQIVDFSLSGQRIVNELERLSITRPLLLAPAARREAELHHPWQADADAFVESFNGKFREYCLDLNWFTSFEDARLSIERWRAHYNHVRPHDR